MPTTWLSVNLERFIKPPHTVYTRNIYFQNVYNMGKLTRAHTINFELRVLKLVFNLAIKWGYLKDNPTKNVTRLKVNDSKPPRFLTKEECHRLLDNSPDDLYPVFYTLS